MCEAARGKVFMSLTCMSRIYMATWRLGEGVKIAVSIWAEADIWGQGGAHVLDARMHVLASLPGFPLALLGRHRAVTALTLQPGLDHIEWVQHQHGCGTSSTAGDGVLPAKTSKRWS